MNKTAETQLHNEGENATEEFIELHVEKTFGALPNKEMNHTRVNWILFWLVLLVGTGGGLMYRIGDDFSIHKLINAVASGAEFALQFGKTLSINLMGGDLPMAPMMAIMFEQLSFILSGGILLSVLGLLWTIFTRFKQYKNRCSQMPALHADIATRRDERLELLAVIQSMTVELDQVVDGAEPIITELVESHATKSRETTKQLERLEENMQRINALVEMMQNIAEQTHIASLNATIRIGWAGESGREVAAIAGEMQHLANLSGSVTNKINERIKNMQQDANGTISVIESTEVQHIIQSIDQPTDEQMQPWLATSWELKMSQVALAFEQTKSVIQKLKGISINNLFS